MKEYFLEMRNKGQRVESNLDKNTGLFSVLYFYVVMVIQKSATKTIFFRINQVKEGGTLPCLFLVYYQFNSTR